MFILSISLDVLLRWAFLSAICFKLFIYLIVIIKMHRQIGLKKVRELAVNYLKLEHILNSAWRLGTFLALLICYGYFYFYFKSHDSPPLLTLWGQKDYLVFAIVTAILLMIGRSILQSVADWLDCNLTIKKLKRVATTKKILKNISLATNALMWTQPLVALKWSVISQWSIRMITAGKLIRFSEKWVDKKIQKQVGQYIGTMILATLIESFVKIGLVVALHFVLNLS